MPFDPDATPDRPLDASSPLWADGEFWLRVRDARGERTVHVPRPYGLVGRLEGADVQIDDRLVSARHVYLHLEARGLYVVDLASRTGSRLPVPGQPACWMNPGQALEVAGCRIRLLEARVRGASESGEPRTDLLSAATDPDLARAMLYPVPAREAPRSLDSELVFAGRSASCGVRVEGASASRVHAAFVRARSGVYLVDLLGRGTTCDEQPVPGAMRLQDGAILGLGVARFRLRVESQAQASTEVAAASPALLSRSMPAINAPSLTPDIFQLETVHPNELAGMVMKLVHAGQSEALRRQDDFQRTMVHLVQQLQRDNAALLSEHVERLERLHEELASLRDELQRRVTVAESPRRVANASLAAPTTPPLRVVPSPPPQDTGVTTDWLLDRVSRLEEESRSTWKDFLNRLSGQARPGL